MMTQNNKYEELRDVMILDMGSTIPATFTNADFVHDVGTTDSPLVMSTNTSTKKMNVRGQVKGFGSICYNPNQITYIFGFSQMANKHRITYDSNIEDA